MTSPVLISPSILAADFTCLGDDVARAAEGGCDDFHVDIMDGHFVPNLSFGPQIVSVMRELTDLPLDVHLMVDNPLDLAPAFARAGATYLTFHYEVVDDVAEVAGTFRKLGVRPGISVKPDVPVEVLFPHLHLFDIVLVMSVYPGFGGQEFLADSYERIRRLSAEAQKLATPPLISVDGGVGVGNVRALADAGANHLVAGTAVFKDHGARENIRRIRKALSQEG